MASIFKRGEIWWVKFYIEGKPQSRSLKTTSKHMALREKQAIEAMLLEPHSVAPVEKNPACEDFWQVYLAYAESHKRPKTVITETAHWNQLIEFTGATRLGDITSQTIEGFKQWKRQRRINPKKADSRLTSPSSVNAALKDIRTIYNYAIRLKLYTGRNPVDGVPFYKTTRTLPKFHTEEELERLLESARSIGHQLEWVVLLGANAGLRKNEILSARWEWFNFKNKQIHLRRYPGFEIKDHEERVIPMHSSISEALEPHAQADGPLFRSTRKSAGKNLYPFEPKKGLLKALEKAELPTTEPFQRLRETFASLRAQKGVSIYKVSKWLGHSSVQTTQRHYAALGTGYDADIE